MDLIPQPSLDPGADWTAFLLKLYGVVISILAGVLGVFLKNLFSNIKEMEKKQSEDSERIAVLETMAASTKSSLDHAHGKLDRLLDMGFAGRRNER